MENMTGIAMILQP